MKILITTDNISGVWTYTLNLTKSLINNGIEVVVAVIGNKLTDEQKAELAFTEWYFTESRQEWMPEPWDDIDAAGKWLLDLKNTVKPDIIHLNSYSLGSLPWDVPVVITAHSCALSWWEAVKKEKFPNELLLYKDKVTRGLQAADVIVAPSYAMLKSIEKFYNPRGIRKVIYNGAAESDYSISQKENIVFCMGKLWDEAKNLSLVLKAAPSINSYIYIAGDNSGIDYGIVPGNVHFTGQLTHAGVSQWLAKAAIFLLPVKYEPFGYSFLEAAFSGCVLVTGKIDSMKEIWDGCAIFANHDDADALSETINRLLANEGKRRFMSEKARSRALAEYTIESMTSCYLSLYGFKSEHPRHNFEFNPVTMKQPEHTNNLGSISK